MLDRLLLLSKLVSDVLTQRPSGPEMLTVLELQQLRETIKLLRLFEKVTLEISGENTEKYIINSRIIPLINCITYKDNHYNLQPNSELN